MRTLKSVKSRKAVLAAIAECDAVGREAFRTRYGFDPSASYVLRHAGKEYDSKAILGVAFGYQFPGQGHLLAEEFSGGLNGAGTHLGRLGFEVDGVTPGEDHWTLQEVEIVVAAYFEMMQAYSSPEYSPKERVQSLAAQLPSRNSSAISRKISNISSILMDLALPMLRGYGPLGNRQTLLEAVTLDFISERPDSFDLHSANSFSYSGETETSPPTGESIGNIQRERRACRIDFALRDEANRKLGHAGEEWAVQHLRAELEKLGRRDLAGKVRWVSKEVGDGLGYDIEAFDADGSLSYVEVKTTNGSAMAPFVVSANELATSRSKGKAFVLMRIFSFSDKPQFYRLRGALDTNCSLSPRSFTALPK